MKKLIYILFIFSFSSAITAQTLQAPYERSGGKETTTYFECIRFYNQLAAKHKQVQVKTFGMTDAGYPLHLVIYTKEGKFVPTGGFKGSKLVILINNGIHPGEPDGIDASMMLLRDMVEGKINTPSNVVIGIIPIYNIGGSLNRNSYSRVNQDGPPSYGFRGNAQNLDLNRDFTKSDSKNAKAFAEIFHHLNPDILIDNHVSDGADYQYTMTLLTTQHNKLGGELGEFLQKTFEPAIYTSMESKGWPMTPYVNVWGTDPSKGWTAFIDPPRYASGYAALFSTLAFVPETHMLKPFPSRVKSTYELMHSIIQEGAQRARSIKAQRISSIIKTQQQKEFPLQWKLDSSKVDTIKFLGYKAGNRISQVTGMEAMYFDKTKPYTATVPYYNHYRGGNVVTKPKAYIIPRGWHEVVELLKLNKVNIHQLPADTTIEVEVYRIEDYKTMQRPYEKHYKHYDVKVSSSRQKLQFLKGDHIIYTGQHADRFLVEMLEPEGDDSYFAWNFFDAILQQKEWYSDYRWEDIAAEYLQQNPALKLALEEKKKTDSKFAASAPAQLEFVYKHSPYYEPAHLRYPVYRLPE